MQIQEEHLSAEIARRVATGIVPKPPCATSRTFGGFGDGSTPCDGCGQVVATGQVVYEVEIIGARMLSFHLECHRLWSRSGGLASSAIPPP